MVGYIRPGTLQLVENRPTKKGEGGGGGEKVHCQRKSAKLFLNIFVRKSAKALFYKYVALFSLRVT